MALVYDSGTVGVRPIVQGTLQLDNATPFPTSIDAELVWNGAVVATQTFYPGANPDISPGSLMTLALQMPTALTGVGRHVWEMNLTIHTSGGSVLRQANGQPFVVENEDGAYGAVRLCGRAEGGQAAWGRRAGAESVSGRTGGRVGERPDCQGGEVGVRWGGMRVGGKSDGFTFSEGGEGMQAGPGGLGLWEGNASVAGLTGDFTFTGLWYNRDMDMHHAVHREYEAAWGGVGAG